MSTRATGPRTSRAPAAGAGVPDARRCRAAQAGMTLLELLVALAIFSVVAGALYTTFTTTLAGRDRALERAESYALARSVLDRIESDLRGSIDPGIKGSLLPRFVAPASGDDFESRPTLAGGNGRLLLELTTLSARGVTAPEGYLANDELSTRLSDRGDLAHVLWRSEDGASGPALVRYEWKPPRNEAVDLDRAPRQVVAENVRVRLDFYAQNEWSEAWDSVAPGAHHDRAPALVRTAVELDVDGEEPIVLVSATALAMVAGETATLLPATGAAVGGARPANSARSGDGSTN